MICVHGVDILASEPTFPGRLCLFREKTQKTALEAPKSLSDGVWLSEEDALLNCYRAFEDSMKAGMGRIQVTH